MELFNGNNMPSEESVRWHRHLWSPKYLPIVFLPRFQTTDGQCFTAEDKTRASDPSGLLNLAIYSVLGFIGFLELKTEVIWNVSRPLAPGWYPCGTGAPPHLFTLNSHGWRHQGTRRPPTPASKVILSLLKRGSFTFHQASRSPMQSGLHIVNGKQCRICWLYLCFLRRAGAGHLDCMDGMRW